MANYDPSALVISGLGVTSAIGQGKTDFSTALLQGHHAFAPMLRPGRQAPGPEPGQMTSFIGAEIAALTIPAKVPKTLLRTASLSGQVALATLDEAWQDAQLDDIDPTRIGLVIGGSNFQQRELELMRQKYQAKPQFIRPTYGMSFMDSDLCGLCTEVFNIRGFAYTIGGASASGQVAVIQAAQAVLSGQVDVCIALGALMDLSYWECLGFRSLGAMGSDRYAGSPELACRPFDRDRDGFIFGESCGAVVIQRANSLATSTVKPYAQIAGFALGMDGNRNPNPSLNGEVNVIKQTLTNANVSAAQIDYVNPHGTGSGIGDEIELQTLAQCGLNHAYLNATKSIIGHGLTAAGTVEVIATLLQMEAGELHPTRNLEHPMVADHQWVRQQTVSHQIETALNLSLGFGGINSALCLKR